MYFISVGCNHPYKCLLAEEVTGIFLCTKGAASTSHVPCLLPVSSQLAFVVILDTDSECFHLVVTKLISR